MISIASLLFIYDFIHTSAFLPLNIICLLTDFSSFIEVSCMERHQKSFFGQKVGLIFDSGDWTHDSSYFTFVRKKEDGTWEKPSKREGRKIKLNLGELIMLEKVLTGTIPKWSTVHRFKEQSTSITVNRKSDSTQNEVWINITGYAKSLRSPETDILGMILKHIIKEKIVRATVPRKMEQKQELETIL